MPAKKRATKDTHIASPRFFTSAAQFRQWLEAHHDSVTELVVGFHRVHTGTPCMTWTESVREALCFGWIDGHVKPLDADRYTRRFTPRKSRSIWSLVNVRHVEALVAEGRMMPAGLAAFEARPENRSGYSFEQRSVDFPEPFVTMLREHAAAFAFWEKQPPSYRKAAAWWVISAKQDATRHRRMQSLLDYHANSERIPQFVSTPRRSTSKPKDSPP
jgi:uncharacterized protein YdeI (YjbR/CyaY-like superfamily)